MHINSNNHILKKYILSDIKTDSGFYDLTTDTALIANHKFLNVISEKKIKINRDTIYSLKFMIKQSAKYKYQNDLNSVGSESTRLIVYNKSTNFRYKVLFDTKFYQPVCEVADYNLDTIQLINLRSTKYISVDLKCHYVYCCGCSEIDSLISYVYDSKYRLLHRYNTLLKDN